MVVQLEVTFKHAVHTVEEGGVGVQACHLVLVLVGHEFEQVTRHRFGQRRFARGSGFGLLHLRDERAVLLGIGGVLVAGKEVHAALHQALDRLAFLELDHLAG